MTTVVESIEFFAFTADTVFELYQKLETGNQHSLQSLSTGLDAEKIGNVNPLFTLNADGLYSSKEGGK